jgi:choline dehydrogenase-like flavoprotein
VTTCISCPAGKYCIEGNFGFCEVHRLVKEKDQGQGGARAARLADGGELVMAAGAVGTPQILQLSGIGPADLLRQHGIAVRKAVKARS